MLVPPNHPTSIVKTIKKLHENAMLRTNIGQAAMSLSRDFEWQNIADQTTDFIDEVLMKH